MKTSKVIIKILFILSFLWVIINVSGILKNGYLLFYGKDILINKSQTSASYIENVYKNGYPIPATISIQLPSDTCINLKTRKGENAGSYNINKDQIFSFDKKNFNLNDTSFIKDTFINNWIVIPSLNELKQNENWLETKNYNKFIATPKHYYTFDTLIPLKSKSKFKNFALAFYSILGSIMLLLISINVFKLFKKMVYNFNFLAPLNKAVFNIGFTLVIWQMCKMLLSLTYASWFGSVMLDPQSKTFGSDSIKVQFNPTIDFDITLLLFGVSLIVMSSLFKYGNKLEQEQALTI